MATPANPNASQNVRRILNYIEDLPNGATNRVMSSQDLAPWITGVASGYASRVTALHTLTGEWVSMVGADYGYDRPLSEILAGNVTLADHWNAGGLVTLHAHPFNPWTGGSAWDTSTRHIERIYNPSYAVYTTWRTVLDRWAQGLADLQNRGVVVLWRPFHEMTLNDTFWWSVGQCADISNPWEFIGAWQDMFNYFTYTWNLNNLIWVYATGNSDTWSRVDYPYPGDGYADIVAIDVYSDSLTIRGSGYSRLTALGKPFAITEFGPATRDGTYNNAFTINQVRSNYPLTTYVHQWHSYTGNLIAFIDNQNATGYLTDSWILNRDELDWNVTTSRSYRIDQTRVVSGTTLLHLVVSFLNAADEVQHVNDFVLQILTSEDTETMVREVIEGYHNRIDYDTVQANTQDSSISLSDTDPLGQRADIAAMVGVEQEL